MASNQELCRWLGENLMDWHVKCHGQTDFVPDDYYYNKSKEGVPLAKPCGSVDSWTPDVSMGQAWQIVTKVKAWPAPLRIRFIEELETAWTERVGLAGFKATTPSVLLWLMEPIDICLAAKTVIEKCGKGAN